jgi:HPt (histidine-containing phosphotransfer) domain-containing protein
VSERRAEFDALLAEYRRDLPDALARIDALLVAGRLKELRRAVHTLAGTAGTYGLRRLGEAAAAAEAHLEACGPLLDAAQRAELERRVARVRDEARTAIGGS